MTDTSVPIMDWLNEANAILNAHWLAPDEPWEPRRHILKLEPDDWYPRLGEPAASVVNIRVVSVSPSGEPDVAWVRGHGLECRWQTVDCRLLWCFELLVSAEALRRAATAPPQEP